MKRLKAGADSNIGYAIILLIPIAIFAFCTVFLDGNEFSELADLLAVMGAFAAVWISYRVWDTANKQTVIADSQLKIAKGLADQELFPEISVSIRSDPGVIWIAVLDIKNFGKRPALDLRIELEVNEAENEKIEEGQISIAEFAELIRKWKPVESGFPYIDAGDERRTSLIPFRRIGPGQLTIRYSYEWKI